MSLLLLVIIYIGFISLGLPDSVFGVSWPVMHIDFHLDQSFASIMTVIIACGTVWTSMVAGKVIRKFGTGKVAGISILMTAISLVGISFAPSIWFVILFMIILGIGAGAVDAGLNDYVSRHYKPQHMSWLHCFWGVGVTVSPLIMAISLKDDNWRIGYRRVSVLLFIIAVIMLSALPLWKKMSKNDFKDTAEDHKKTDEKKVRPITIKGVGIAMVILAFYCSVEMILGTWGASFLINTKGINAATAAKWISFYFGGIVAGRFINGFLSMRFSDKVLILGGISIGLFGAILLMLPISNMLLLGSLVLIGAGYGPIFPCSIHATSARFGEKYSPDIVGYQMGGAYMGALIIQPAFGFVASKTTFLLMPYVLLVLTLLQLLLTLMLEKKLKKDKETIAAV